MEQKKPRNTAKQSKNDVRMLHRDIKELSAKVDRIYRTLIGDEEMAQEGLVVKVQKHDEWIENQKVVMAKIFGIAIGSGLFGGAIMELFFRMFSA